MTVIGLCVVISPKGPTVSCVLVSGDRDNPSVVDSYVLKTSADGQADRLVHLAQNLRSKISGLEIEHAVIRVADVSPKGNRSAAPRNRLLIEGALMLVCREQVHGSVCARTGKEVGEVLGVPKVEAVATGKRLVAKHAEAAAAAISGLPTATTSG
ncbi:hypothetical protein [Amycolatopsis balhimycina]|uniref:hypothetical protein n=1 Tax=Amycolatopsis balhimycina TaxID=208443 RepID=UPI000F79FBAE|nr:hypothetical protein [Amycolatopsis balhimycina]